MDNQRDEKTSPKDNVGMLNDLTNEVGGNPRLCYSDGQPGGPGPASFPVRFPTCLPAQQVLDSFVVETQ